MGGAMDGMWQGTVTTDENRERSEL
jgi:hypothetical protein